MRSRTRLTATALLVAITLAGCGAFTPGQRGERLDYEALDAGSFASALGDAMAREGSVRVSGHMGEDEEMIGRYRLGDPDTRAMTVSVSGKYKYEMTLIDHVLYGRSLGEPAWSRYPPGMSGKFLGFGGCFTPHAMASTLEAGVEDVERDGWERIHGQVLHRYRVEIARNVVAKRAGLRVKQIPDVTYWYWLDRAHLLQRFTAEVDGYPILEIVYHGWGDPVVIELPTGARVPSTA